MNDDSITRTLNAAADGQSGLPTEAAGPVSKEKIADLEKQLSQPVITYQPTPEGGTIRREIRTDNDRRIMAEIADIKARLDKRRHNARDDFNRASDGWEGEHAAHYEIGKRGRKP
jgi:molecular chaperone GrpE (heat shock protein)